MVEQGRDANYRPNIDYSKSIQYQNLLHQTRVIMAIIYRDYLCQKEEKEKLLKQERQQYYLEQKELKKIYSSDNK
ncbi:MAG: hypothetical protein IKG14_05375 [Clostridia bacterium]|nr:hypothetical protein [Clostridia bacterium]